MQALASTATYPLSLHDGLPIWDSRAGTGDTACPSLQAAAPMKGQQNGGARLAPRTEVVKDRLYLVVSRRGPPTHRSEEHTSELQSRQYLVCRLLLDKKTAMRFV